MRMRVLFCVIFLLVMSVTIVHASAPAKHACAPSVPTPVSGPFAQPPATTGLVFINEVLTAPSSQWSCSVSAQYTAQDAWVELYNPQDQNIDLYAMGGILDSGPAIPPYRFTFGTAIAAHSFLVLFPRYGGVYNLLFPGPSTLRLSLSGLVVDQVSIPPLGPDASYARIPDGSSNWVTTNLPTIGTSNILSQPNLSATATSTSESSRSQGPVVHTQPTATVRSNSSRSTRIGTGASTSQVQHGNGGVVITAHTTPTGVDGLQPTWVALQFPLSDQTTATAEIQSSSRLYNKQRQTPTQPSSDSSGVVQKVLFSFALLAVVLLLVLLRRFLRRSPDV